MSDRHLGALAVACLAGALVPLDVPVSITVVVVGLAIAARWPILLVVAAFVLCAARADDSWRTIDSPMPTEVTGTAVVRADPERDGPSTTALLSIDGRNVLASAWGPTAAMLGRAQAGDHLDLTGRTRPWPVPRSRQAALHTAHRMTVDSVAITPASGVHWRIANTVRDIIGGGAAPLDDARRALFTGIVYGDDRGQSAVTEADFRLAGLTHLLAVSGQNVALMLVLLRPLVTRLSLPLRWGTTLVALGLFATATRFEPSVLRATAMAAIVATGALLGRETPAPRILAIAVCGLVVHDPLLAMSVGFQLSVAATLGIVVLQPTIAAHLGGGVVAQALAVTIAAQLAVAPLLVHTFGPVSIVSIPANLLAGPVAGLLMTWGLTAGVAAGLAGGSLASMVHAVTLAGLWWLETVAHAAAAVPLRPVGLLWIGASTFVWLLCATSWRRPWTARLTIVAIVILAIALRPLTPAGVHVVGPANRVEVGDRWRVLVLDGRPDAVGLLEDLRRLGVRRLDLVVVSERRSRADLDALLTRVPVARVMTVGETTPTETRIPIGEVDVIVVDTPDAGPEIRVVAASNHAVAPVVDPGSTTTPAG